QQSPLQSPLTTTTTSTLARPLTFSGGGLEENAKSKTGNPWPLYSREKSKSSGGTGMEMEKESLTTTGAGEGVLWKQPVYSVPGDTATTTTPMDMCKPATGRWWK